MSAACRTHRRHLAGCADCRVSCASYDRRRRRRIAEGTWLPTVPAGDLVGHLEVLRAAGMSLTAIARAAGLSPHTVYPIASGRQYVHGPTAAAVLAVEPPSRPPLRKNLVDTTGTARRVRALVTLGYPLSTQTRMLGWAHVQQVWELAWVKHPTVTDVTAASVAALFERLSATPAPPSSGATRARNDARRHGWYPPLAWDDIDDPTCQPNVGTLIPDPELVDEVKVHRALRGSRTELTDAELVAAVRAGMERGATADRMADRLAVNRKRVRRLLDADEQQHRSDQPVAA